MKKLPVTFIILFVLLTHVRLQGETNTRTTASNQIPIIQVIPSKAPSSNLSTAPVTFLTNAARPATNTILPPVSLKGKKKALVKKSSRMVNLGFYYLFSDADFKKKFSNGSRNRSTYYRMPVNSWNDPFYIVLDYDWRFLNFPGFRWGWSFGLNFAGSGNGSDSIEVPANSKLRQDHPGVLYAIYNDYHFPFMINIKYGLTLLPQIKVYAGGGGGAFLGVYTYNELAQKERSTYDEQFEKTFIDLQPVFQVFLGFQLDFFKDFSTLFFEVSYKMARDPVIKNDLLPDPRSVSFQISGLSVGAGFRY